MCEETESSVEEAARDLQAEQRKELEQMQEKQMLTLELEEMLEEEANQVFEILLEMEQTLEEDSEVRELQLALDVAESQQRQEARAGAEAEAEAGSGAARSVEQKAAADGGSSPAAGADVFSPSLEDEENRTGVAIRSLQKVKAQLEGAPTSALVGLRFWEIGLDMLSGAEMEMLTAIATCPSLGQCKTCQDGRNEGGG
ncbi:tol-Pal system protein TolA-like isoform X2 [Saccopteryx bilineata]